MMASRSRGDDVSKARDAVKQAMQKTAAFPPFSKNGPPPPLNNGPSKRDIPKDHPYDPRALKPMSKALWAASMALGHALASYREMSRLKSATVSPDGMMGGRGYVMQVRDMRQKLFEACEGLSAIADTLYDEINAPHWRPKLALLDENDQEDVERFVEKSQDILESPEDEADEEMKEIEEENDKKPPKKEGPPKSSEVPGGGPPETNEAPPKEPSGMKQASVISLHQELPVSLLSLPARLPSRLVARFKQGNSSLPVDSLPGPRVDHLDRAEPRGPWGSYNEDEPEIKDPWQRSEGVGGDDYMYPNEWENDLREAGHLLGESAVPDSNTDDTPTETWDFGIGYGARGQGAGGYGNPSNEGRGKGVWGPQSGLPGTTPQSPGDSALSPAVDQALNERHAEGVLPQDVAGPPARTDYFVGPKDNVVQGESTLPGEASPWGTKDLPGLDTRYVTEDVETPYTRWDFTTPNNRPEHQYGRPEELPWAHDTEVPR